VGKSRILLPEHRTAILHRQQEAKRRPRPELDEHQLEKIQHILRSSLSQKEDIIIRVYKDTCILDQKGKVIKISNYGILFQTVQGEDWINIEDILDAD